MTLARFPRHILMTADTVGGVWTYAMELCSELGAHGIRVSLATMGDRVKPYQWAEARAIPNLDLYESTFRLEWMDDAWGDVHAAGQWLLDLQRRTNADLVHLNGYAHGALPWTVPSVVVAHSCVLSWWRAVKKENAPDRYHTYRHVVTLGIRGADALVAPSEWMLDQVRLHYSAANGGAAVPNGRSGPFAPGLKQDVVFCCGRVWDEAKNIGLLCSVAPFVKWPIAIAGDTRHPNGKTVALSRVRLLGTLPESHVAEYLRSAAIYALPAYYEPFGLSVLEAARSGCALVLGRIASLQEIWDDAAIYVAPDDEAELVRAINGLIENPERRKEMATRALRRSAAFTPERMAAGYLGIYGGARRHFDERTSRMAAALESTCA
jgi:glycosyltransferase involved in cell wall biosynthesis